jgi:hypothetical protein
MQQYPYHTADPQPSEFTTGSSALDIANALRAGMVDPGILSDSPPASTSTEHPDRPDAP